jgi:hypothetical protein
MESSFNTGDARNTGNDEAPHVSGSSNHKWEVLISVIFGTFIVILDSTAVNVAIPTLQREFKALIDQVDGYTTRRLVWADSGG